MEEESPEELFGGHGHQPLFALVRIILPAEGDLAIGKAHDPVIGNGDAMRVSGQILEDMCGSSEGPLRIDYPLLAEQRSQEGMEGLSVGEHFHASGEVKFLRIEGAFQARENFPRNTLPSSAFRASDRMCEPVAARLPAESIVARPPGRGLFLPGRSRSGGTHRHLGQEIRLDDVETNMPCPYLF
jgi:hypothetical protein